ncbi:COX15/CtaA family protein [Algiphilus aromaticivorans]|jgi:cytochrome c oxidase assembly protein subunit 15|uniref:COX15/CtaA family protein n=1 Tax=Algiphilus aromaticivorans TaxID=382454 RepID=UPI0005C1A652|nr:COX15/CtaA family protein [Algiphilus aromaticivorans]
MNHPLLFRRLAGLGAVLALCVIVFGAFVRLSDAGLGCPDWPGCYGQLGAPSSPDRIAAAEAAFPEMPVDTAKAWIEMGHRYAASLLGLLVIALALIAWRGRRDGLPWKTSLTLLGLVVFQGMLGMWTVTLLLKPAVVTAHLLGGMTTLALLFGLWLSQRSPPAVATNGALRALAVAAIAAVGTQIALGGWVSTNYAALACTEFPTCHDGQWLPAMDLTEGFVLWRGIGQNYEYGVLEHPARTAIHIVHRIGAVGVTAIVGVFALLLMAAGVARRGLGLALLGALALQIAIGIGIVVQHLPLGLATAHNAGAALLLLTCLTAAMSVLRAPEMS